MAALTFFAAPLIALGFGALEATKIFSATTRVAIAPVQVACQTDEACSRRKRILKKLLKVAAMLICLALIEALVLFSLLNQGDDSWYQQLANMGMMVVFAFGPTMQFYLSLRPYVQGNPSVCLAQSRCKRRGVVSKVPRRFDLNHPNTTKSRRALTALLALVLTVTWLTSIHYAFYINTVTTFLSSLCLVGMIRTQGLFRYKLKRVVLLNLGFSLALSAWCTYTFLYDNDDESEDFGIDNPFVSRFLQLSSTFLYVPLGSIVAAACRFDHSLRSQAVRLDDDSNKADQHNDTLRVPLPTRLLPFRQLYFYTTLLASSSAMAVVSYLEHLDQPTDFAMLSFVVAVPVTVASLCVVTAFDGRWSEFWAYSDLLNISVEEVCSGSGGDNVDKEGLETEAR